MQLEIDVLILVHHKLGRVSTWLEGWGLVRARLDEGRLVIGRSICAGMGGSESMKQRGWTLSVEGGSIYVEICGLKLGRTALEGLCSM